MINDRTQRKLIKLLGPTQSDIIEEFGEKAYITAEGFISFDFEKILFKLWLPNKSGHDFDEPSFVVWFTEKRRFNDDFLD